MITGPVYGQPLVDPGQTGLEPVDLRLPLTERWDLKLGPSGLEDCCWLLATARQAAVQSLSRTFFVDWRQRAVVRSVDDLEWVALSPDSTLVKHRDFFKFLRRPPFWPTGVVEGLRGHVLGARATKTTLDVLLQHDYLTGRGGVFHGVHYDPSMRHRIELWRIPWQYPPQYYTTAILQWQRPGLASAAAFGPDGSVVVALDDKLVVLDEAGRLEREIPGRFLAGCVSIDEHGTIYAFEQSGGSARLIVLAGKQRSSVALGPVEPVQPPVPLPGGAVRVIAKTGVLGIDGGVVRWGWWAGDSGLPLATATRNGYVVVGDQRRLVALDEHGKVVWQAGMPGPIVSNPLITAEGGVCFVWQRTYDKDTLTCLSPAQASP